jgi:hypothetical protein
MVRWVKHFLVKIFFLTMGNAKSWVFGEVHESCFGGGHLDLGRLERKN